jgi:hypothetical protein
VSGERQNQPRFDGRYVASDGNRLRFNDDGGAEFADDRGTWKVDHGVLLVSTPRWQCEGALDATTAYLLCSPEGRIAERVQLELRFEMDAGPEAR